MSERPISPWQLPPGHPGQDFLTGRTPLFALGADPRVSYCLYVPPAHTDQAPASRLLVTIHDSHRDAWDARESVIEFARQSNQVVLAPLFPAALTSPNDLDSYKLLDNDFRADLLLLAMIEEAATRWNLQTDTFDLYGFSGGGQFAHRFFYLHPERLASVTIGAPGRATLIDPTRPWWQGTGDIAKLFSKNLDLTALRKVRTHLLIGELDDVAPLPGTPSRLHSITALHTNWREHGIDASLSIVPETAHDARAVTAAALDVLGAHTE